MTAAPEDGRNHELRTGINHRPRGFGIDDRSGAQQESFRQRRRQAANQLDGTGHRHRHLERSHAARDNRVDDRPQFRRIAEAYNRHDAELFDLSTVSLSIKHDPGHAVVPS